MTNHYKTEIGISLFLIALLILILNPFGSWMPSMLLMTAILIFALLYIAFLVFVWNEKPRDERERLHLLMADRWAFLVGTLALTVGIIVQNIRLGHDNWLIVVLGIMILTKIFGLIYGRKNH